MLEIGINMVNFTTVKFHIVDENGEKYGAFAVKKDTKNPINVENIFKTLQNQQPDGVEIKFEILSDTSKEECDKLKIDQLDNKEKIENFIKTSLKTLKNPQI